jgi:UDP:flavonoid glycosyltransferase YjiC (YdhE family)
VGPVDRLRAKFHLPRSRTNAMFDGQFSPHLNLALFSPVLARPQPDWPPHTVVTGFPLLADPEMDAAESDRLEAFLAAGAAPIVFTLGTTAVNDVGDFFRISRAAAELVGARAILLVGKDPRNQPRGPLPATVLALRYVPFALLLPRAALTVHQGGVGTTGQALRSGRPQVVVPFANDQPDNAARVHRLGVGLVLSRHNYTVATVSAILRRVLQSAAIAAKAKEVGEQVRREDGAATAADAIEGFLDRS